MAIYIYRDWITAPVYALKDGDGTLLINSVAESITNVRALLRKHPYSMACPMWERQVSELKRIRETLECI